MKTVTPPLPLRIDRHFQTWRYAVGHSLLALRSPKPRYDTNIDVLFHAVKLMLLTESYDGLALRPASQDELTWVASFAKGGSPMPEDVVVIGEDRPQGFVWCTGGWWIDENDLEYYDPPEPFTLPSEA